MLEMMISSVTFAFHLRPVPAIDGGRGRCGIFAYGVALHCGVELFRDVVAKSPSATFDPKRGLFVGCILCCVMCAAILAYSTWVSSALAHWMMQHPGKF